ncbi:DUF222 domain-containing protein [Microterricola gilva]|nr:DUF222 domain-containing protein [Microterricola gilva]
MDEAVEGQLNGDDAGDPVLGEYLFELGEANAYLCYAQAETYRVIEAARRRALAIADPLGGRRSLDEEFAQRSLIAEIALVLRMHERTMHSLMYEAQQLVNVFPTTLIALAAGEISQRHAREILAGTVTLPPELHARFEAEALPKARVQSPTQFRQSVRRLQERLSPEALTARAAHSRAERRVVFEPAEDGMAWLKLYLEADKAWSVAERVSQLADQAQGDAVAAGDADDPVRIAAITAPSTHAQLEADVAVELLLGRAAPTLIDGTPATALPALAFSKPEVFVAVPQITIGIQSLTGQSDEPAELHGYGSIPADVARGLVVHAATFRRVLIDPEDGTPLALDPRRHRMSELFPGAASRQDPRPHGRWRAWSPGDGTLRWLSPTGHYAETAPASTIGCTRAARAGPPGPARSERPAEAAAKYPDPPPF